MAGDYQILEVAVQGRTTVAVLPLSTVFGADVNDTLHADYTRLAESAGETVELDLRAVESTDGNFFGRLVELYRALKKRSIPLQLRVSPGLKEVLLATKLDQVMEVI